MIYKRRFVATGLAIAATQLLIACGTGSAGGPAGTPSARTSATVLTLGELRTLDPAKMGNNFASGGVVGNALFGTLLVDDPSSGDIRPSMGEAFTTADGGQTFELKLLDRLVFTDGSPLDAEAVKYNWDRMRDPATGSPYRSDASMVASTTVVDRTRLRVTMTQPVPNFAHSVVTTSMNWIASPAALAAGAQAFDANPIGAGPFTLKAWRRDDAMELVKNPKYWDAPKPYLDHLTLRPSVDAAQRVNTVTNNDADAAIESNWQNLKKANEAGLQTIMQPLSGGNYIAMNMRRAPFDDNRARAALAAAINPQALNESAFDGAGLLVDTLFTTMSSFHADIPASSPDRATAQRLFDELAAAGKPLSFTFTVTSATENRAQAEAIQAQLRTFRNVSITIKTVELAQLQTLQTSHDFDATVTSAAFLDPEPRLWTAFRGDSPSNMSGVDDQQLNAALLAGRTTTTDDQRRAAYDTVQQRLVDLHPMIWIARTACAAIATKTVGGLIQYGFGSLRPEELWIGAQP
ncbi:ABC transporter substrate-binding protein [Amycolatopsis sp. NBRC 101858]|nr:ABC transporter substrate-binding protein [Amycolatopsis sp. NBRC 101858]